MNNTLLNNGIPPNNTIFRLCNINANITNISIIFSDRKLISLVFSIVNFLETIKLAIANNMAAKIIIMVCVFKGSLNL